MRSPRQQPLQGLRPATHVAPPGQCVLDLARAVRAADEAHRTALAVRAPVLEQVHLAGGLDPGRAVGGAAAAAPEEPDVALARRPAAAVAGVEGLERRIGHARCTSVAPTALSAVSSAMSRRNSPDVIQS